MKLRTHFIQTYFKYFKHLGNTKAMNVLRKITRQLDDHAMRLRLFFVDLGWISVKAEIAIAHVSLISNCNLRCRGCLYGRDFMPKEKLDLETVKRMLDEFKELGIPKVHFYGGEPLLHVGIYEMVAHATQLGIFTTLGSNAVMLERKNIDRLHAAGLRHVGIGIYGIGEHYDNYVNIDGSFDKLEQNLKYVRQTYPDISLTFSWLLSKKTCNLSSLNEIFSLSQRYQIPFDFSLIHYDFPYFTDGEQHELQFFADDRPLINNFIQAALKLKEQYPSLLANSEEAIRSIPDWLIEKADMRVPCHRYRRLWIGPNGVVRVCQKNCDLGNIRTTSLKDMLFNKLHQKASQDCYELNCTNCHVGYDERVRLHGPSKAKYSKANPF